MKTKHLVITRLAIKWRFKDTGLEWIDWLEHSIDLMNTFCRPSLENQSSQDFQLISLIGEKTIYLKHKLHNEIFLQIPNNPECNYEILRKEIIKAINDYISTLEGYDSVIITRIDRDDCLGRDFIENVRKYLSDKPDSYVDLNYCWLLDKKNNIPYFTDIYNSHYPNGMISPFVSTHELIKDGKIQVVPFLYDHNFVHKALPGTKIDQLNAMHVIHEHNLKNRLHGKKSDIDLKFNFGINIS